MAAWGAGQLEEVDRLIAEVIANFRREHDDMGLGWSLCMASLRRADLDTAGQMAAEADELLRQAGVPMGVAHNAEGRGIIAFERGELNEAANFLTEAIQAFASYGNIGCTAHALEAAAVVIATASRNGDSLALELLAAAEQFRHQSGQEHTHGRYGPGWGHWRPASVHQALHRTPRHPLPGAGSRCLWHRCSPPKRFSPWRHRMRADLRGGTGRQVLRRSSPGRQPEFQLNVVRVAKNDHRADSGLRYGREGHT